MSDVPERPDEDIAGENGAPQAEQEPKPQGIPAKPLTAKEEALRYVIRNGLL